MDPRLKKKFVNYNPKQETTATRTEGKTFPVGRSVFKKEVVRLLFSWLSFVSGWEVWELCVKGKAWSLKIF